MNRAGGYPIYYVASYVFILASHLLSCLPYFCVLYAAALAVLNPISIH